MRVTARTSGSESVRYSTLSWSTVRDRLRKSSSDYSRGWRNTREACRLATGYAFRELGMEKVYLKVYETNPGGRRAYEKAGYKLEGTLPRDHWWEGGFTTSYLMAVHRDDPFYGREEEAQ